MTTKELIEILKSYPEDMEVILNKIEYDRYESIKLLFLINVVVDGNSFRDKFNFFEEETVAKLLIEF